MALPGYIQQLIDSGDASIGINASEPRALFIGHPHEISRRGMATDKLEAVALGKPVFVNDKGARVRVKTEGLAQEPGMFFVTNGKNIDKWGKDNLARNSSANPSRRANAREVELANMDELEARAAQKYGYISQALQDDAHHIVGINSGARYKRSLTPDSRARVEAIADGLGLYAGDHPRNLSAIPGERAIRRPNLHQSVIHTAEDPRSVTALLGHYGLPNSTHSKWDLVSDVQAARQFNTQREAAAIADMAIQRLSVQMAMLDPKRVGSSKTIEQSKELISRALANTREMAPYEVRPSVNALATMLGRGRGRG